MAVAAAWGTYRWRWSENTAGWYTEFGARCGIRSCRAPLARRDDAVQLPKVLLHPGFIYDFERQLYRLGNRAQKQWARARAKGTSWRAFWPTERHPQLRGMRHRYRADRMPWIEARLPVTVVCPLCGFVNQICEPNVVA